MKNFRISISKAGGSELFWFGTVGDEDAPRMRVANRGVRVSMKALPSIFSVSVADSLKAPSMNRETIPRRVILEVTGKVEIASVIKSAMESRRSSEAGEMGCLASFEKMVTRKRTRPKSVSEYEP